MKSQKEDKPIYNIQFFSQKNSELKESSKDILTWKKEKLSSYLRGIFDGNGFIYFTSSKEKIFSIRQLAVNKLETFQKALQLFGIFSFIYYSNDETEINELFIVGEKNILLFEQLVNINYSDEIDSFYNCLPNFDWED